MRPRRSLDILKRETTGRLHRLRRTVIAAVASPPSMAAKHAIAICSLELVNTWAQFARSFFLSCCFRTRSSDGSIVFAPAFLGNTFNDAIGVAIKKYHPKYNPAADGTWHRRDEPAWHDPAVLRSCCDLVKCSNKTTIDNALSLQTKAFEHAPVFRNYFGHRNASTESAARKIAVYYAIPSTRHPLDILSAKPTGRPYPLLADWIDDITVVVSLICS